MSLRQFNINPATLMDGVEVVPNGLTYMLDLQQQGYVTVELQSVSQKSFKKTKSSLLPLRNRNHE